MNELVEIPEGKVLKAEYEDHKKALARAKEAKRPKRPEDRHKFTEASKLRKMVAKRLQVSQIDALEALYDLATMDEKHWSNNSALAQVKMLAAKLLAFPEGQKAEPPADAMGFLQSLNDDFHKTAPRIKSVRERIVTFESGQTVNAE